MDFVAPGEEQRRQAIGSLEEVPDEIRAFFQSVAFEPIAQPAPSDWLANHPEPGQTFKQFLCSRPHRPDATRHTIYLQPIGDFPPASSPDLRALQEFTHAFFAIDVQILPALPPAAAGKCRSRVNAYTRKRQLLTGDLLDILAQQLPADGFCLLGISLCDLYPDPTWNFVFGEASVRDRVGVYSFARYDPHFYGEDTPNRVALMLRRSCKVLAHETGHMLGVDHCIYFRCLMNGSNHIAESDARPMHLCPLDLRKLYDSIHFDPVQRCARLNDFCRAVGFADEAAWLEMQLARVASREHTRGR